MRDFKLREYQTRLVDAVRKQALLGHKRILAVLPTGAGKSACMGEIAMSSMQKGNRVLAMMHRRGLVEQMIERFNECGIEPGCIMAGVDSALDRQCQVASIWTYKRRIQLAEKDFNRFWVNAPVVLIDEAHHILNATYQKVLSEYPNAFVVGFTATPTLSTGAGLGNYFDCMVNVVSMSELLAGGFLVPGVYYGPSEPDLAKLKIVQGDYDKKGLDEKINRPEIVGNVVDNWIKYAGDKLTMVFAINRKHAMALCNEFIRRGITAEYLDANNEDEERSEVLERSKNGDTMVICQIGLYTEGSDLPWLQCLVVARPTRSLGLHRQILGRGARPCKVKQNFMVLDHGGNCKRLGFYEDEIEWTLDGKPDSNRAPRKHKERKIIICDKCAGFNELNEWTEAEIKNGRCVRCGHEIQNFGKKVNALQADLIELKKPKDKKEKWDTASKRQLWGMLDYERRRLCKEDKWQLAQYKSITGVWPRGMDDIGPIKPDQKCLNLLKWQRIKYIKGRQKAEAANGNR